MAVGKNKRLSKGGKKGQKKKIQDPMMRKEWYDIVAPANFKVRQFGKTICNKTQGLKIASQNLNGRVYESNLADLKGEPTSKDLSNYRLKFEVQEVQGRNLLTQFHGMEMANDKLRSLFRKWCTTVESVVEAKTADGYTLRLFLIAFTARQKNQLSKNCYGNQHLLKWARARMTNIIQKKFAKLSINDAVTSMTNDALVATLTSRCNPIIPLRDIKIRKVKVLRTPVLDIKTLSDAHGGESGVPESLEDKPRVAEEAAPAQAVAVAA